MPAPRILFVKLSSLGDVVHHLPAVSELHAHLPNARIAWAVEEGYARLIALHPAVSQVIPVGLRGLRSQPWDAQRWSHLAEARRKLRAETWDYVIDTQGLVKSGLIARMARGRTHGLDTSSARERAATIFYDERYGVPRDLHAVERNRRLVASAMGYEMKGPPRYGLVAPPSRPSWAPEGAYAVMLQAASREAKRWPEDNWIALATRLARSGIASVFPGGTDEERATAARIAAAVPDAMAAPPMDLDTAAALLGHASRVAGVDTGLTHLAVALDRPTVGIYRATRPALTGLHGASGTNLGGPGETPSAEAVAAAMRLPP
ncbi:MAG TPA: lipopolysaccharide heptosyltransferase I [Usitatibacter sp.]|nr:lipopolysaccharide heptosyltransferase I [Usitatibacter sp.]